MRALNLKLLRDLGHIKGQAAAITLVIASAVAVYVMAQSTMKSLEFSRDAYYERHRFARLFAPLKRAPLSLAERVAEIPGVATVDTRIVADVTLDVPGLTEPAVGRLISIPERGASRLNDLYLRSGRHIEAGRGGEVLANEAFMVAHGFGPGAQITATINGRKRQLTIVGVVLSPEYVIQIRGGDLLPDDKRFGVFWMSETELAAAFDMEGAFNNIAVALMPGASEREVLQRLDQLLEPYGAQGGFGHDEQVSARYLSDEIKQLKTQSLIVPAIFLGVAAFLLNVVLTRLIATQRQEIAALKAFGYTNFAVGVQYLKLALLIAVLGTLIGIGVGSWLGTLVTQLYTQFYKFPSFGYKPDIGVMLLGLGISVGAAMVGALGAVRGAVVLPPAEAMRPPPPANYRPTILERLGFQRWISPTARMILRNLERRPFKAGMTSFGIALAVSILVVGNFSVDALNYMMDFQFQTAQRQDLMVSLVEPSSETALHSMRQLPGVTYAEPFRVVPSKIRSAHRFRRVGIMGLAPNGELFRVLDDKEKPVAMPPEGIVLSSKLAEILEVGIGDTVTIEVLEGERPVRAAPVAGIITEYSGINAYMDIRALNRFVREGNNISGAFLSVESDRKQQLYSELKKTPKVAGVVIREAALQSFRNTMAENLLIMQSINIIFACIIAFGVVYNSIRISFSERAHELASLRVLGFTRAEISMILLGELALLTLIALPVGFVIGYGFSSFVSWALNTELYRIPLIVENSTYAFATTIIIIASLLSGLVVRRKLDHLDLIAVLKAAE